MSGNPAPESREPNTSACSDLSREDMLTLIESGRELSAEIGLELLLQRILQKASRLTDSADTSIILLHEDRAGLYVAAATGDKANWVLATFGKHSVKEIPIEGSKAGEVFSSGVSIVENHLRDHFKGVDQETRKTTESMVCVPLRVGNEPMGVMQILNKREGDYNERDRILLEHFASQAAVAIKNAQLFESALAHSGFYMAVTDSAKWFEVMRDLARPAHAEKLTVMFADMRGFTQLCQSSPSPVTIQRLLNEFISMMADAVISHGGIVNKFLGDGIMALFRGDDHPLRAVKAALHIAETFDAMKNRWNDDSSEQLDFLDVGMGIVTGEVTIGGIGSDKVRDFTAIGSAVNLAAALEHEARGGRRIIVNQLAYNHVKNVVAADPMEDFVLKKPEQTVGIRHKRYCLVGFSRPQEEKLFISHSHNDRQFVDEKIVKPLNERGVKTWYALTDIPTAALWPAEIRKGLAECTSMIVVVSKNSQSSQWVRLEVDVAVGLGTMTDRIIPLRLDNIPSHSVNPYLSAVQGIDVWNSSDLAEDLIKFLKGPPRRPIS